MAVAWLLAALGSELWINVAYRLGNQRGGKVPNASSWLCLFYTALCGCWSVILVLVFKGRVRISLGTWVAGGTAGLCLVLAVHLYMQALSLGPFVATTRLYTISTLLPIVYSAWFLREPLDWRHWLALGGLVASGIWLAFAECGISESKRNACQWMGYLALTILINSLIPFALRWQAINVPSEPWEMMAIFFGTATIASLFWLGMHGRLRSSGHEAVRSLGGLAGMLAIGIGVNTFAQLLLPKMGIPAAVQYPIVQVCGTGLSIWYAKWRFQERLNKRAALALLLAVMFAILLSV